MTIKLPANWKTSAAAIVSAFFLFVTFYPSVFPPWLEALAKFAAVGGLAAFGVSAKDKNVTGGTIANPNNDPKTVSQTATAKSA